MQNKKFFSRRTKLVKYNCSGGKVYAQPLGPALRHLHPPIPKQLSAYAISPTPTHPCVLVLPLLFLSLSSVFSLLHFPSPTNPKGLAGKPNWFNYIVLIRESCLRIEGNCTPECTVFSSQNGRLGKWREVQIYPSRLLRPQSPRILKLNWLPGAVFTAPRARTCLVGALAFSVLTPQIQTVHASLFRIAVTLQPKLLTFRIWVLNLGICFCDQDKEYLSFGDLKGYIHIVICSASLQQGIVFQVG